MTVEAAAERFGIERLGFLTLTFADHVTEKREAQERFNSLASRVLADRYHRRWCAVWERQRSGRLHAHLLVALDVDIRTGVDFEAFKRGDYRSARKPLSREWRFWRAVAPRYRFGRTELLPIRSTAGGMAHYVGKYLGKDLRSPEDKGSRRYAVGSGMKVANQQHQSVYAFHWRRAVRLLAEELSPLIGVPAEWDAVAAKLGGSARWIWAYRDDLAAISEVSRRSEAEARVLARAVARGERQR